MLAVATLALSTWLNARVYPDGVFGSSSGFPFTYIVRTDVLSGFLHIDIWAIAANALIAFVVFAGVTGSRPQIEFSLAERAALAVFVPAFLWANSILWEGPLHLFQHRPWIYCEDGVLRYGFPFAYDLATPGYPVALIFLVDMGIGALVVVLIHGRFTMLRRENREHELKQA
jgi:hypothetical protein